MELIKCKINNNIELILKNLKLSIFDKNIHRINIAKIGYFNIYHKKWDSFKNNIFYKEISLILNEINENINKDKINFNNLLYAGFIYSFPNCDNQKFHFDYSNNSITYFIPLNDITDLNGTEYLFFKEAENYNKYLKILNKINNCYSSKVDIENYLKQNNINNNLFNFKIYNGSKFCLYKLPNNIFHRGKVNETKEIRIMFQITILNNNDYLKNIINYDLIKDAELDDNYSLNILNKLYFIKYNNKYLSLPK